jgi:virulence factor Mce-like protein
MKKRGGIGRAKAGALLLVVVAIAVFFGFTKDIPYVNEPYEIKAAFRDTSGMRPGSPVRIAGVEVGEVRKVEHTKPGSRTATVTMAILDKGKPIKDDARATIRPRIFLEGNFFVDLSPGTPGGEEMEDGDTIPVTRTANPVQLDQVLKALRVDVREQLKTTFSELGHAERAGAPQAFNRSLDDQPGAYRWTSVVSDALLGQRPGDLGRVIDDTGDVAAGLDRNPQRLQTLVTDFNRTMAAFAESDADLRATIRELPDTMREALPALRDLNAAFPSVRRLAREIRPGLRSTPETSEALIPLAIQLRGLVGPEELRGLAADLRTSAPPLARLSRDTVPLLDQIRPLASCTRVGVGGLGSLTGPVKAHPASGPVYQEAGKFLPGLAGESRSFDANGQWFKVLGQGGAETFDLGNGLFGTALQPVLGVNPPPDRTLPPYRPDTPCETQQLPSLETKPGVPPKSVQTGSPAADARTQAARAVALALTQVQNLVSGNPTKVVDKDATAKQVAGK